PADHRQVEASEDRLLRLVLEQELERTPHEILARDAVPPQAPGVRGSDRDRMHGPLPALTDPDAGPVALQALDPPSRRHHPPGARPRAAVKMLRTATRERGGGALLHLLRRHVLTMRGDAPAVPRRIRQAPEAITPEHVLDRHLDRGARLHRPGERLVD